MKSDRTHTVWAAALVTSVVVLALNACGTTSEASATHTTPPESQATDLPATAILSPTPELVAPVADAGPAMMLISPALEEGGTFPERFTCDGVDVSPPLAWESLPPETEYLALIFEDPDAPGGTWIHWVIYNLPAGIDALEEGSGSLPDLGGVAFTGENSWGNTRYGGPCPPSGTHRYFFRLLALDQALDLPSGASLADVENAMQGHILAEASLMSVYKRGG